MGSVVNLLLYSFEHLMRLKVNAINHRSTTSPFPLPHIRSLSTQFPTFNTIGETYYTYHQANGRSARRTHQNLQPLPRPQRNCRRYPKTAPTPHQNGSGSSRRLRLTRPRLRARLPPHQTRHPLHHQRKCKTGSARSAVGVEPSTIRRRSRPRLAR